MQPKCLIQKSGLLERETESDLLCATGDPLDGVSLPLVVQTGKAFLTSVSKHAALSSQAYHFDLFSPQSFGKGMEAEVGWDS